MAETVTSQLPSEGQNAMHLGNAATVIQVVNGIDMLLSFFGIVPPGTIPVVVNGVIAIGAGITQWYAKHKAVKVALYTQPSVSQSSLR